MVISKTSLNEQKKLIALYNNFNLDILNKD